MKDNFQNELVVGDQVAFLAPGDRSMKVGQILGFTSMMTKIVYRIPNTFPPEEKVVLRESCDVARLQVVDPYTPALPPVAPINP